ncbi:hypothetical protein Nepgr_003083 [Nepenthes gracilis]|uniref:Disease resistance R13L4/SHOC-2-like LRR domain-containing protein n=1 Tax=Nepenthes gracilis TaxID=150966 RepID=A0AAD3XCX0_NEPGR|nr:hypothetical protein Nepgr_003083 [Nepenthes gracilis]
MSRIPSLGPKPASTGSDYDIEQPPPFCSSQSDASTSTLFVDPLVEQMPHLKDPKVIKAMTKAVSEIAQTRLVLQALGDRPDHETIDRAKEKIALIDENLSKQLEEIVLSQRPAEIDRLEWRSHLADKETQAREAAEKEKQMYISIIQLDEMHESYQKLLKDAEAKLLKIYDSAASAKGEEGENDGGGERVESSGVKEEVNEEVIGILQENASGKGIENINLSRRRLRFLPEAFGKIPGLRVLNMSNNQLEAIPDSIGGLENLEVLNLYSNLLESLPDSIGLLVNLKTLNVSGNKLHSLPDSICHCRSLVELDVSFNNLTYLPTNIGYELVNLRRLSVQYNKINFLPTSIGEMRSLQHLDAHFNELRGLPFTIGKLTNLENLNLSGNFSDLTELPDTFCDLINLKELDLSNNQIHALPDTFGRLENLIKLNLDQNPIVIPPAEVVNEGVEAVKAFMAKRWLDILVAEEEKSMLELKEGTETGWLKRSLSQSTSWLKQQVSSISEYLGTPRGSFRDPWLDQQL